MMLSTPPPPNQDVILLFILYMLKSMMSKANLPGIIKQIMMTSNFSNFHSNNIYIFFLSSQVELKEMSFQLLLEI